jgi:hypothetical protein
MSDSSPDAPFLETNSFARALVWGWLVCGVLDISAACIQASVSFGTPPVRLLQGVASALLGKAAFDGGAATAALGLLMHFVVALTAATIFCVFYRRTPALRALPVWLLGPLYGLCFFCLMNYATLPGLSWLRSLYLGTSPRWPGSMGWPQALIHMVCVGTPIVAAARRFLR